MSNPNLANGKQAIPAKDRQLLDLVLEGKPDAFKVKVYEIVRLSKMDANDPSFLLLVATGRLEVLLEQFPHDLSQMLQQEMETYQQGLQQTKKWFEGEKSDLKGFIQGIKVAGEAFQSNLAKQTETVAAQTKVIREEVAAERAQIARERAEFIELVRVARDTYQTAIGQTQAEYDKVISSNQQAFEQHQAVVSRGQKVVKELSSLQSELRVTKAWVNVLDSLPPLAWLGTIVGSMVVGIVGTCFYFGDSFPYLQVIKENREWLAPCFYKDSTELNPNVKCTIKSEYKKGKKGK
jgi:vacuolar-type H+-ATPase subunit D/Vma8